MRANVEFVKPNTIKLQGVLTFKTAQEIHEVVTALLTDCTHPCIDLTQVEQVDSAGLALLVSWKRYAQQEDLKGLVFKQLPERIESLAQLCGVDTLISEAK